MRERVARLLADEGRGDTGAGADDLDLSRARPRDRARRRPRARARAALLDPRSGRPRAGRRRDPADHGPRPRARGVARDQPVEGRRRHAGVGGEEGERRRRARVRARLRPLRRDAARLPGGRLRRPDRVADRAAVERDPEVAAKWQERCAHLLVDEYQDTNPAQYRLLRLLAGETAAFTAVGDDDQAIYGWRGATLDNLAQLPQRLSEPQGDQARAELPLDGAHPALGQRADRQQREALRQEAVERAADRRHDPRDARSRTTRPRPNRSCGDCSRTSSSIAAVTPTTRSSTAAITRRSCSSSSCARRTCPTRSPAGSRISTAPRSATSSRTCASSRTTPTTVPSSAR